MPGHGFVELAMPRRLLSNYRQNPYFPFGYSSSSLRFLYVFCLLVCLLIGRFVFGSSVSAYYFCTPFMYFLLTFKVKKEGKKGNELPFNI